MKGGTRTFVMSSPLMRPSRAPQGWSWPGRGARFCVLVYTRPPITAAQANTDPTDRSIPPERMTNVSPAAMMAMTAVCRVISKRLSTVKK